MEEVNRGGFVPDLLSRMELGTPRGKDTTTGSYSALFGDTSTRMERLFLGDGSLVGDDDGTLSALRFLALFDTIFFVVLDFCLWMLLEFGVGVDAG